MSFKCLWGRALGEGCPRWDSRSEVQQNQLLGALPVRTGTGLKQHLFKQKPNRTSSLTELASGILFPHSNLLLMLPSPGLLVSLPWEDCTASQSWRSGVPFLSRTEPLLSLQREGG